MKQIKPPFLILICVFFLLSANASYDHPPANAQARSLSFPQTGHTVQGVFLDYWDAYGGLAQFGYPISDEILEVSEQDSKTYTVQYFERAVFELHPENKGTSYEVLLSLLGSQHYLEYYGPGGASGQHPNLSNPISFPETGHTIGGSFRAYWEQHGGLAQQGYPISDEFEEVSAHDGKTYTVQYFERAVFELHPENKGTPYEVLLTQLGNSSYRARHGELTIPGTSAPDLTRFSLAASDSYVVWSEGKTEPADFAPKRILIGNYALDLRTGEVLTVAPAQGHAPGFYPVISGSVVVWEPDRADCQTCHYVISARDLSTGVSYSAADGPGFRYSPSIGGNNGVWIESAEARQQLVIKNLDTGLISTPITNVHTDNTDLLSPLVSDQYLAWVEAYYGAGGTTYNIQAYNLKTSRLQFSAQTADRSGNQPLLALSGHHLVWVDTAVHWTDLDSGQTVMLAEQSASYVAVRGNTVIWRAGAPGSQSANHTYIWGIKLSDLTPVPLVVSSSTPRNIAIARDWLVWGERTDMRAMALTWLFAQGRANIKP